MLSAKNGIARSIPPPSDCSRPTSACFLRTTDARLFADLVKEYGRLLDRAVEQREYKAGPPISRELRELADRLGRLGAGARDVIELHRHVLGGKLASAARTRVYVEEGRLLVLELMGHLLSYYRTECLRDGAKSPRKGNPGAPPAGEANRGNAHE